MHEHLMNIAQPGSYAIKLNKTLKLNGLPENPPSRKIILMPGDADEGKEDANAGGETSPNMEENALQEQITPTTVAPKTVHGGHIGLQTKGRKWIYTDNTIQYNTGKHCIQVVL